MSWSVRMPRSVSTGVVIISITLAIVGIIVLISRWTDDRPADTGSITVVQGAAPPTMTTDHIRIRRDVQTMAPVAGGDVAVMEQDMAASPRDQRTAGDEVRLRDIIKTTLPGLRSATIVCAGPTCRVSGDMPATVDATRGYFRSVDFFDAIFALGYSPGPDNFKAQGTDTAVLVYLKRES